MQLKFLIPYYKIEYSAVVSFQESTSHANAIRFHPIFASRELKEEELFQFQLGLKVEEVEENSCVCHILFLSEDNQYSRLGG